ncbi:MAG: FkbM family methyltransferase [Burkholderiales bacterium]|jgi:FkbM family methyltransferase
MSRAASAAYPVLRVDRSRIIKEFVLRRLVSRHRARSRAAGEPRLFCMPEDHIGLSIATGGLYERDLLTALFDGVLAPWRARFAASTALDVGANIGNHACFLARRFHEVLAFEPSPTFVHLLHANRLVNRAHNIVVHPVGLGRADAVLPFCELSEGNLGSSAFVTDGAHRGDATHELQVRRADGYLLEHPPARPVALVKIDVEGFETEVLDGLRATLVAHRPFVLFESSTAHGERGGEAVRTILSDLGYRHFHAVERRHPARRGLLPWIRAALTGADVWVAPIDRIQDRYYSLILASVEPIDAPAVA